MGKKIVSLLLVAVILSLSMTAFAAPTATVKAPPAEAGQSQTIYLPDGGKLVVTKSVSQPQASAKSSPALYAASSAYTEVANARTQYFDGDAVLKFEITVSGNFVINPGVSVQCTDTWYTYSIFDNSYSFVSQNDYASNYGTTARASSSWSFNHKWLFIVIKTISYVTSVKVDVNGNASY